ncbi:MAG: FAD:protein FMN transferase [Christensenellales bacterium]
MICLMAIVALIALAGCTPKNAEPVKFSSFDYFDTVTDVTVYGADEAEIARIYHAVYGRLHHVFDAFYPHTGVNGVYQLNRAGGEWAAVEPELLDLLLLCRDWQEVADATDVTQGALFRLWHAFRSEGGDLPTDAALEEAARHGGWALVEIDEENARVRLNDPNAALDLGAVAKGYAAGKLGEAIEGAGYQTYIIDAGGNVVAGYRERPFVVGVTDPINGGMLMRLSMNNLAAVTSGDYQRYREYEGVRYHHIVDTKTLRPADTGIRQVTVIHADSGFADYLSTSLFLMDYESGRAFCEDQGIDAIWLLEGGAVEMTEGARGLAVD